MRLISSNDLRVLRSLTNMLLEAALQTILRPCLPRPCLFLMMTY